MEIIEIYCLDCDATYKIFHDMDPIMYETNKCAFCQSIEIETHQEDQKDEDE